MAKEKRPINEELVDVWAVMLSKEVEELQDKIQYLDLTDEKERLQFGRLSARVNGITHAMTLFTCLEDGRYQQKYDSIVEQLKHVNNNSEIILQ